MLVIGFWGLGFSVFGARIDAMASGVGGGGGAAFQGSGCSCMRFEWAVRDCYTLSRSRRRPITNRYQEHP